MRFSANLGFLWADRPLPQAIEAAMAAGFDVNGHTLYVPLDDADRWPWLDRVAAALAKGGVVPARR